ncbi:MAG: GEVED domain-containing protein [Bacteroidota bacterium]
MKSILPTLNYKLFFAIVFIFSNIYVNAQYCPSNGNMTYNTSATRVIFNTIDNSTAKPAAYNDYTSQSTDVTIGNSYDLTVQVNTDGPYTIHSIIWIDWNNDEDFLDAGEEYDMGTANNVSDGPTTASPYSVPVPSGASIGATRMRVSAKYSSDATSCETNYDGEVEDYNVNILAAAPSSPTFYNKSDNNTSVYFDNIRTAITPIFALSSTHSGSYDSYYVEINTEDDFTGTAYTQTISGTYSSGTKYDIFCDSLSPALPTTQGVVYYVRAKASDDGGLTWGSWSTQTWSFTYNSTSADYGWHQTAEVQFTEGTYTGSYINNTVNGNNTDYIYSARGAF